MIRVVSLYLPSWPIDRLQRLNGERPETAPGAASPVDAAPLILVGGDGRKRVVVAADENSRSLGVRPGMAAAMAQALVAGLIVRDADPAADAQALDRLALWLLRRYAPVVATDPPDGLMIDITGATHLHGGEQATLTDMIERLAAVGITARVGAAGTYGAAHALARYHGAEMVVIDDGDPAPLLDLPIAALRLPAAMIDGLRRLGFDRIGELAATPRAPLALRFGSEVGRRLDQMFGRSGEPFALIDAPELIRVRRTFAEPIAAAETIARYITKLVDQLCVALEERGLGARKLDLLFYRVDNAMQAVRVGTAKPVRDRKRLIRLLCDRIETVSPGFGIETMILSAPLAEPLDYRAGLSNLVDVNVADISELIDVLANRVGDGSLYRVEPVASDVPERSTRRVAALAIDRGLDWSGDWPRPARLFSPPERIETVALLPDHPPAAFTWRGTRRRVKRADGPERVFGEWWKRDAETTAVRDYFQVEDDAGERFWLFRAGDGEDPNTGAQNWFIHGIFG